MRLHTVKLATALVVTALAGSTGAAGDAMAQSSVTIFGLIDVGVVRESGGAAGAVTRITSGMSNGSRLGFKGVEDLGHGWSALFMLESGFQLDDGTLGQGGALFGRQSYMGVRAPIGTLTFGRQYTSHFDTIVLADPFGSGLVADAKNLMPSTGDASTRSTNSIKYTAPSGPAMHGASVELMAAAGEVAGNNKAGAQWGGALGYTGGRWTLRLGHHYRNSDTAQVRRGSGRSILLAAVYNAGPFKAHFGYGIDRGFNSSALRNPGNPYGYPVQPVASTDSTDQLMGISIPDGRNLWLASWVRKDDRTGRNQDARQVSVGHRYTLSKRTDTYVALAHISNRNGASYTTGNASEVGTGNRAVSAGVRHQF